MPDHLINLPGREWALWRSIGLRSSGFPFAGLLRLSAPECAKAADDLIRAEEEAEQAWQEAFDALQQELMSGGSDRHDSLVRSMRRLKKGKVPDPPGGNGRADAAIEEFASRWERTNAAWPKFRQSFEEAIMRNSQAIEEVASNGRFQEALIWQNRRALHTGMAPLLTQSTEAAVRRNQQRRRSEELAAIYWQRYCAKNDTIGFFGPVGWARFDDHAAAINLRAGAGLLAERNVYFEEWCISALAAELAKSEQLRLWLTPRRQPSIFLEGATLYHPFNSPVRLPAIEAAALRYCDGERPAKRIAEALMADEAFGIKGETDVYGLLDDLQNRGLITWAPVLWSGTHPELGLQRMIDNIGDETLRNQALELFNEMERARSHVARAAGAAESLDIALAELEATFTRLTGVAPTRNEGQTYGGRTLIYEDCRRDIEIEFGPHVLEDLGPPLTLLLASARWLTFEAASICRKAFKEIYENLVRETRSQEVSAFRFWLQAEPFLHGGNPPISERLRSEFQKRWAEALMLPQTGRSVSYTSDQLRPRVLEAFYAPHPGWSYARYQSPDIMIAAESDEAIRRGDYQLIMGELHAATNCLSWALFPAQHPSPQELFQAIDSDLPEPRIVPQVPRYWDRETSRLHNILISPKDLCLEFAVDAPALPGSKALSIGSLVIESEGDGLIAGSRDGQLRFDIIEAFGDAISSQVIDCFKLIGGGHHCPRVSIDRLVVSRETWCFDPSEIEFAYEKDEAHRFIGARRWAREQAIPRFAFYRSPVEIKPCYLDFDSPLYIDIFARMVRRALESDGDGVITMTEMLPGPDQLWLLDAEGQRYTTELRMVALDLTKPRGSRGQKEKG